MKRMKCSLSLREGEGRGEGGWDQLTGMELAFQVVMDASKALTLVQPLLDATQDMKHRKVSKSRCDELLQAINSIPLSAFEGQIDLERLWMQSLSSFRYALLLWLYGDVQAARDESEKARRKVDQIREQTMGAEAWTAAVPCSAQQIATH
jgi:hypothetical protein